MLAKLALAAGSPPLDEGTMVKLSVSKLYIQTINVAYSPQTLMSWRPGDTWCTVAAAELTQDSAACRVCCVVKLMVRFLHTCLCLHCIRRTIWFQGTLIPAGGVHGALVVFHMHSAYAEDITSRHYGTTYYEHDCSVAVTLNCIYFFPERYRGNALLYMRLIIDVDRRLIGHCAAYTIIE
ncbi:unnamed protein product [Somion occarium]|uniref:Uncharacterized protein n=1 Tax=Somion occarium TaxID=3059160 RepID=A0ABP1D1Z2_9APHY